LTIALAVALAATSLLGSGGCGCRGGGVKRPYPPPADAEAVLAKVREHNDAAQSFRAKSTMDYWVGKDRVKGTVLVQGKRPAFMRFNALNPGSGNVAVDLACQNVDFKYLNYNDNCKLVGPCNADSIAQLLRVRLAPEDFLLLAVGSSPILPGTATNLSWDSNGGYEVVDIVAPDGRTQTLKVDLENGRIAVVQSRVTGADGKVEWTLTNKDFHDGTSSDGKPWTLPGKTRFQQPADKSDLIVDWQEVSVNLPLEDNLFDFDLNMGIHDCGSQ